MAINDRYIYNEYSNLNYSTYGGKDYKPIINYTTISGVSLWSEKKILITSAWTRKTKKQQFILKMKWWWSSSWILIS